MECRNCQHYLDDEYRYCPRCGTPRSLGWPAAGGPWLRRPAVVAGLALLLVAWLAALQRQLSVSDRPPAGSLSGGQSRIAARPLEARPTSGFGRELIETASLRPRGQMRSAFRKPYRDRGVKTGRRFEKRIAVAAQVTHPPHPARPHREWVSREREHQAEARSGASGGQTLLAAYQEPLWRRPTDRTASRHSSGLALRPSYQRYAAKPWSQAPVFVKSHDCTPSEPMVHTSNLVVNVSARPYGVKTFVYMDGGRELGIAPLRVRFERPGRHRLLFFAPSLGPRGRVYRNVHVTGQNRQWVSATMGPSRELARF